MIAAAIIIFGYWIGFPFLICCLIQDLNFVEMLSLYGYSFLAFVPACAIAMVPVTLVRVVAMVVASMISVLLL